MRGGKREGAGRKSLYGSPTRVVRIPIAKLEAVKSILNAESVTSFPLFACAVSAGFPSPADDHMECKLDLNDYLIKSPSSTFFARASGDSMIDAGIHDGDLMVVDRSLNASNGKIIIAVINGELTVKRYVLLNNQIYLYPENKKYKPIKITQDLDSYIWGVVTSVIHKV